jgi:hypothetical protein
MEQNFVSFASVVGELVTEFKLPDLTVDFSTEVAANVRK